MADVEVQSSCMAPERLYVMGVVQLEDLGHLDPSAAFRDGSPKVGLSPPTSAPDVLMRKTECVSTGPNRPHGSRGS